MAALPDIAHNIASMLAYDPAEPMLFSSGIFWALFLVFMPLYGLLRRNLWQMLIFVVGFSFFFYYKSSGVFVLLLAATSLFDWLLSRYMAAPGRSRRARRLCVAASLTASLGILAYFKYANFFLWNFSAMVGSNFAPLDLVLPVGISFYTFQSISYIVDVYKGRVEPTRTWLEYAFFLSFFPALVAGPIVRADYFLPQIRAMRRATHSELYTGLWLIIAGVIKKAVIADYIAMYNDLIFDAPGAYSGFETLMGIIGYTMQIYCDFSGYSDMAIGIAMIMGFRLAKNFDFPYKARNLTDFWHRWHISLSSWLRDYVYIPLGGNRRGKARTYVNNFATMLIGGLWHGAAWKFVFWGAMHGAGLAVHKATGKHLARIPDTLPVRVLSWALTMAFVAVLWVFFRADSWESALAILGAVGRDFSLSYIPAFASARMVWLIMMLAIVLSHAMPTAFWDKVARAFVRAPWAVKLLVFVVAVQLVLEFRSADVTPFIYFQF
ncbi:MAG: MBOAT family protein [Muribaculaceae bacterium]|nr:MBOAT family protein [Muribaculaceae bacterium]